MKNFPGKGCLQRLPRQLLGKNPFGGDCLPARVPWLWRSGRPCLPFPHPWNYQQPLAILESFYWRADQVTGAGRHNRYLELPGLAPVLVTRDPGVIRAILTATGDRNGQLDRDTLPSRGIARATGKETLLFGNGALWRRQRKLSASPFGKTSLFQIDIFCEFEQTFRKTVHQRLLLLRQHLAETGTSTLRLAVEPEIKTLMLEMLVTCFFGAEIPDQELREKYVPALERVIEHIVEDTVINPCGLPHGLLAKFSRRYAQAGHDFAVFDELTDRVLAARSTGRGLWRKFQSDVSAEALRSNIKVFLAGALEATTSFATWTLSHLARNLEWQDKVFQDVEHISDYSPEQLHSARHLDAVLEETLRLTPSLYFLPRKTSTLATIETADGRQLIIPADTHILLDIWHANRHPDHWGVNVTGYAAEEFAPERWEQLAQQQARSKEHLHFGFGHGPRVCPGKHLGQLEVALVVGSFVKLFRFRAVHATNQPKAGVSTKPADGTLLDLELRQPSAGMTTENEWQETLQT